MLTYIATVVTLLVVIEGAAAIYIHRTIGWKAVRQMLIDDGPIVN